MTSITIDLSKMKEVGDNVLAGLFDGQLVMVIDPGIQAGLSASGKTATVGNTHGHVRLPGDLRGSVYVGKPK